MTALARTAAAAIAVVACLGPAPALAQWEAPVTVSEPIAFAETPSLAAGADGRVLLTYGFRQPSGLLGVTAVSRRPDGRWGPRRAWGIALTSAGPAPRRAGIGEGLSSIAPYGPDRWLGLAVRPSGRRQVLEWWRGTTAGGLRRGGALAPEPWEAGQVAARPDGSAVAAWTTMPPRRGARGVLRPRVVVLARRAAGGRAFGRARRISPLPPPPPYGQGRGPALSATAVAVAYGGRRTVAVAWHREGELEARISRDDGRTFGPVRRVGPSPEAFPRIAVRVSADDDVVLAWAARERAADRRALVVRAARTPPARDGDTAARFSTQLRAVLLERTPPIAVPAAVADQFGPGTQVGFADGTPVVAWQGVEGGRVVVRLANLGDTAMPRTLQGPGDDAAVLDDLLVGPGGIAVAWHPVDSAGVSAGGHVAIGPAGGAQLTDELLPGQPGVIGIRLAAVPQGLLAAWSVRGAPSSAVLASVRDVGP